MSNRDLTNTENSEFTNRFIEVCESTQPVEISKFLSVSYQAAVNYLNGRIPDAKILLVIAERTPYSIHWLLTGDGKKIVEDKQFEDTRVLSDEMRVFVREVCVEVVSELAGVQRESAQTKTVILTSDKIRSEKVMSEIKNLSD